MTTLYIRIRRRVTIRQRLAAISPSEVVAILIEVIVVAALALLAWLK